LTSLPTLNRRRAERLRGRLAHLAGEHERDLLGAAYVDVVGHQRFKEAARAARVVEDERAGDLDLAHRELPPVACTPIIDGERCRDHAHPTVEERLHVAGVKAVAELLQPPRLRADGEAVRERGEGNPGSCAPALGPLVPVDPHLRGPWRVGADL
jgi:hypothetical protein